MPKRRTINLVGPVVVHAAAQPEQGKPAGPGTFEAAPAYSGGALPGYTADLDQPVVIDLAGLTEVRHLKANLDHHPKQRVGHVTEVVNDGKTLAVKGVFSAATIHRDQVVLSHKDGYTWETSIETALDQIVPLAARERAVVNGQTFTGPMYIARKSRLVGLAFTGGGADPKNRLTIAAAKRASQTTRRAKPMNLRNPDRRQQDPNDEAYAEEMRLGEQYEEARQRFLRAGFQATVSPVVQERIRTTADACRPLNADYQEQMEVLEAQAMAGEVDPLDFERRASALLARDRELYHLRASREQARPRFASSSAGGGASNDTLVAAFCLNGGLRNVEKHFDERTLDAADRLSRNISLQAVLLQAAAENGYRPSPGERVSDGNLEHLLRAAFRAGPADQYGGGRPLHASGGSFSTTDLGYITANVTGKFLLDGFEEIESPWREISVVKNAMNFHEQSFVRLLSKLEFLPMTPTGEIQHGSLEGDRMTGQAKTRARMAVISREDWVNDNAGALQDTPRALGRGSGQALNNEFWTAFLAADNFWHANNGNVLAGAGSALDIEGVGLAAALKKFRGQRSPAADGSKLVGGSPYLLMVPPALEIVGRRLVTSINATGGDALVPSGNPFAGLAKLLVVDQLGTDSGIAGASDVKWYLTRNPSYAPAMLVVALGGKVAPTIQSAQPDFNRLGVGFRGFHDVGSSRGEKLAGIQAEGVASGG